MRCILALILQHIDFEAVDQSIIERDDVSFGFGSLSKLQLRIKENKLL